MKRFLVVISSVVFAFSLCVHAQITIGVDLSTTGPGASLGIPEKNALAFGPSEIGGYKVRYVVYDDASDSTTALQNVKRLISEEKIDLLLGPSITTSTLGVIDTIADSKTPMLTIASATQIVSPVDAKRRWAFKTPPDDSVYNGAMVNHMVKKGVRTVSVITVDDPFGENNTQEYKRLADAAGIKTLTVEKFKRTDTSVTPQVLRVMKDKPDAVFIIAVGTTSALPNIALVERRYKGKIYHTGAVANADFLRVGAKAVEGAFVPTSPVLLPEQLPNSYPIKAEALRFVKAYESQFGSRSHFAAQMWDALNMLNTIVPKALKNAKPGTPEFREALRTAMEEIHDFKGAAAVYNFSATKHSGVDLSSMIVVRVENGGWKLEK